VIDVKLARETPEGCDHNRAEDLMVQSARCRRLADSIGDHAVEATLLSMAREYEAEATACRG
jgi:hypothetical protein